MAISISNEQKITNRRNVFKWIYMEKSTSKQEIASSLKLSLPTVSQYIQYLESLHLIECEDYYESTGGRKARIVSFCSQAKIAVGVYITKEKYYISIIDLYGNVIRSINASLRFSNTDLYYQTICKSVTQLVNSVHVDSENVLGVGIALQAILTPDGNSIIYGKILSASGLNISRFSEFLTFPCTLIQDAEAAALRELWFSPELERAFFLLIEDHVSGAVIFNKTLLRGKVLGSSSLEHISIVSNGHPCYCGRSGCLNYYCSSQSFLRKSESETDYFEKLRIGDAEAAERWNRFLNYLSKAIDILHLIIDCDIVLGGSVGQNISKNDIQMLHQLINKNAPFSTDCEFIRKAKMANNTIPAGAALTFVSKYLSEIT